MTFWRSKRKTKPVLWIVSGPISVGKSTFIESERAREITSLPPNTPVVFPQDHDRLDKNHFGGLFYHYNTLRPIQLKQLAKKRGLARKRHTPNNATDFRQDPKWVNLTKRELDKKAIVLVANKQILMQRVKDRKTVENSALAGPQRNNYPTQNWLNICLQVDLVAMYKKWCRELRSQGIPYTLVDARSDTYPVIEDEDQLPDIVSSSDYTKEQIEEILLGRRLAYHRVNLPFGLHTPGDDRSRTRDLIFPDSLEGKKVLDVGSALGYFSFEAEARGATKVVGVELKWDRFRDAMLLKDIKGSKVQFMRRDVILKPLTESFDYVFLLNVIHHLNEPFRAIRQLASITEERLIIEFPTFEDRKFRETVNIEDPSSYNELPLIGVSSTSQAGQTFIFTPSAIKRTLLDHERLFEKVDIIRSPMPGRAIAVCYKEPSS